MSTATEHAPLPPSSAHLWGPGGCPGAMQMQRRQPEQEPTEESREGDAAHWLLAQTLLRLTVPDDAIAPNGVPINREMREAIVEMVDDVNDTLATCKPGDFYQVEQRVSGVKTIHPDNWGTPDCYFVQHSARTIHIWDFKYGHRFVDAYQNWQIINYAACVVETEQINDWRDWSFTMTIAQPRCYERDELGGSLREWYTTGRDLHGLVSALSLAANAASDPNASLQTGEHCRDCTAQWDCPANQRMAGIAMDVALGQGSARMTPEAVGLESRSLALAAARINARLDALDAQSLAILNRGESVPHHSIGWTKPRLTWDKATQAEAAMTVQMYGVPVAYGVDIPTPAACIKQGVDETVITPYTTRNAPAQKLVRVDDDRAAKVLGRR